MDSSSSFVPTLPPSILNAETLPSLPAVAVEVLRLTREDSTTIDDLAACISRDPALAAKLLKLSNSSLFSMSSEVSTLQKATMVLGMKSVMLMALSFSLTESVPKDGSKGLFHYGDFQYRSLVGAVAGRQLAVLVGHPELADEAFLCGLLSHFGGLVMAECVSQDYGTVLARSGGNWPTLELEDRLMGFNQADVILALLGSWSIPPLLSTPIGFMMRPQQLPRGLDRDARELAAIMALVSVAVRVLCDVDKGTHLSALQKWAGAKYDVTKEQLDEFLLGLEEGIAETAGMLQVDISAYGGHEEIVRTAREHLLAISLGAARDLTKTEQARDSLERQKQDLEIKATVDGLTSLPNRMALDEKLAEEIQSRRGRKKPLMLGVIMIDVDHFKRFNDTWGHKAGDRVLQEVGQTIRRTLRVGDFGARYGGEEFTVLMPLTTREGLRGLAERIRLAIETTTVEWEGHQLQVTASFGCAALEQAQSMLDGERLIQAADRKLYEAKEAGRNLVSI